MNSQELSQSQSMENQEDLMEERRRIAIEKLIDAHQEDCPVCTNLAMQENSHLLRWLADSVSPKGSPRQSTESAKEPEVSQPTATE